MTTATPAGQSAIIEIPDTMSEWIHHDTEQLLLSIDMAGAGPDARRLVWEWLEKKLVAPLAARRLLKANSRSGRCRATYLALINGQVVALYPN